MSKIVVERDHTENKGFDKNFVREVLGVAVFRDINHERDSYSGGNISTDYGIKLHYRVETNKKDNGETAKTMRLSNIWADEKGLDVFGNAASERFQTRLKESGIIEAAQYISQRDGMRIAIDLWMNNDNWLGKLFGLEPIVDLCATKR